MYLLGLFPAFHSAEETKLELKKHDFTLEFVRKTYQIITRYALSNQIAKISQGENGAKIRKRNKTFMKG